MMQAHFTSAYEMHAKWLSETCTILRWYGGMFKGDRRDYPGYVVDIDISATRNARDMHLLYDKLHRAQASDDLIDVRCVSFPVEEIFVAMLQDYQAVREQPTEELNRHALGYRYFLPASLYSMRVWLRCFGQGLSGEPAEG